MALIKNKQNKITTKNQKKRKRKEKKTTNLDKDVEKLEPLYTVGRNAKWYSHYGKQYSGSSKNYRITM